MNKKLKIIVPLFAAAAFLYIILAARPLSPEIQFVPVWTIDTESYTNYSSDGTEAGADAQAVPFKLGQNLGYITDSGKILNLVTFPYKATVSGESYAVYGTSSERIPIYNPAGSVTGTIERNGFPYFCDDRKFIFLPGGSSFAKLDKTGNTEWTYEGFTPITAFSSSSAGTAVGFANGTVLAFDNERNITHQYNPGGSEYEVILGIAISESADYIATLSGQGGQRFVISKKTSADYGSHTSIIFYKTMPQELNRQVLIKFSRDEKKVFYSNAAGLGIVSCKSLEDATIPIKGRILSILESESGNEVFILSKDGKTYTVSVIESFDVLAGSFSFDADCACIAVNGNSLFIGRNTKISRMDLIHR